MQCLSPIRFGVAVGVAGVLFYVGCMIFMATVPSETVIWLSNSVLHGVDLDSVMRQSIPLQQSLTGIMLTFLGGLVFGALLASIYNVLVRIGSTPKTEPSA